MYGHAPEYICKYVIFFCFGRKVKSYMDTNFKKNNLTFDVFPWVLTEQIKDWNLWRSTSNLGTAYTQLLFV